jgi:glycosyltransferase involved in cell wall biosynthesis
MTVPALHHLHLVAPGDLATPTGGYVYDRRMAAGLRGLGWRVDVVRLDESFPAPTAAALADAAARMQAIDDGALVLIDGLALGAMPDIVRAERRRLRLLGLVHHPLALETGLAPARAAALRRSETAALAAMRRVIVTSPATARELAPFGVPAAAVDVVLPGTDPAPLARGSTGGTLQLLCVAAVTPRKGHRLLIEALAGLSGPDWRLTCIGSLDRDPPTVSALRRQITALGLGDRVRLAGAVDDAALAAAYDAADLFVLPSLYEGYGMAFAEALARGLPVLGCRAGAVPDTVPADAGLLVEPGSAAALEQALARLLLDTALRNRLAAGARRARSALPDWDAGCRRLAAVLERVGAEPVNPGKSISPRMNANKRK